MMRRIWQAAPLPARVLGTAQQRCPRWPGRCPRSTAALADNRVPDTPRRQCCGSRPGCRETRSAILALAAVAMLALASGGSLEATALPVELQPVEFELDNGMTFLVVERPGRPVVSAVWAVRAGSASDPAGQRGLAHVVEHLLFAGSRTIGTADWEAESRLLRQWERLNERSVRRSRAAPASADLARRLAALQRPGEYATIYTRAGGVGLDAETRHDLTLYQALLPAEKIELWFWMESDRLLEPVFRGFERELRVVEQERRQRLESSPVAAAFERFDAAFWGAGHPYAHTPGGHQLEIARLLPADARAHFEATYRPDQLVAALVGDLTPAAARERAERYFGRLRPGSDAPGAGLPDAGTVDGASAAEAPSLQRDGRPGAVNETPLSGGHRQGGPAADYGDAVPGLLEETCTCRRQIEIRYPTVPLAATGDGVALDLLAGVLNGRSGRLRRRLVLADDAVAVSASARHESRRHGGYFAVHVEAAADVELAALLRAWDRLLEELLGGGVETAELERVRRQLSTEAWRQVETDVGLARRLVTAEALGGWRQLGDWFMAADAVGSADLRRVTETFLVPGARAVLALAPPPQRPAVGQPASVGAAGRSDSLPGRAGER